MFRRRASAILYEFLCSAARPGIWLLPANVCPIVPAVFQKARLKYEFVDIEQNSLCIDREQALSLLRGAPDRYAGVLFVRSYGHRGDFSSFFRDVKNFDAELQIIDDRCLSRPSFAFSGDAADLELYSTGYSKFVDVGWGGWGILRNDPGFTHAAAPFNEAAHADLVNDFREVLRLRCGFKCPETAWLDTRKPDLTIEAFRPLIEARAKQAAEHHDCLNAIYAEQLEPWVVPGICRDWRFTIFCGCQHDLIRSIFDAGHFASAHFASLAPMFGPGEAPVAEACGRRAVNLFNDFRYSVDRARDLARIVRAELEKSEAAK